MCTKVGCGPASATLRIPPEHKGWCLANATEGMGGDVMGVEVCGVCVCVCVCSTTALALPH